MITWVIYTDYFKADSKFVPSQWETLLQGNVVSHWLGANLESALTAVSSDTQYTSSIYLLQYDNWLRPGDAIWCTVLNTINLMCLSPSTIYPLAQL